MKFKAVVFDMDGVMFDTESVCRNLGIRSARKWESARQDIWSIKHWV